jgi:hypothetical protein
VRTDAWPNLARVLLTGIPHAESGPRRMDMLYIGGPPLDRPGDRGGGAADIRADDAPQKTEAIRRTILCTLAEMAADPVARAALSDSAAAACHAVLHLATAGPLMYSPEIRRAAEQVVRGLVGLIH